MKPVLAFTIILLLLASACAQTQTAISNRARFEGTWLFDSKESNVNPRLQHYYEGQTLTISYTNPEIRILESRFVKNSKYANDGTIIKKRHARIIKVLLLTDNRGETNKPYVFFPNIEVRSQTEWNDDVLIRTFEPMLFSVTGNNGTSVTETQDKEVYSVSKDGKTLTITMKSENGIIEADQEIFNTNSLGEIRLIYRKKSDC